MQAAEDICILFLRFSALPHPDHSIALDTEVDGLVQSFQWVSVVLLSMLLSAPSRRSEETLDFMLGS